MIKNQLIRKYQFFLFLIATDCLNFGYADAIRKYFDKNLPESETILTSADFEAARHGRQHPDVHEEIDEKLLYRPDRFQGDIVQKSIIPKRAGVSYNAVLDSARIWKDKTIPYTVSGQFLKHARSMLADVIEDYNSRNCVQFVPKTRFHHDYVHLMPDDGCYSSVGRVGGKQIVSLGFGCINKGVITHELMHVLGFFHEQSRNDRDEYVEILWKNIAEGMEDQFQKFSLATVQHLGKSYDYASIMHYGKRAFSKNGRPTIEPKQPNTTIGQRKGLSEIDLSKVLNLYECEKPRVKPTDEDNLVKKILKPTTSKLTPAPSNECRDLKDECRVLKTIGLCTKLGPWAKENCAKTCGHCEPFPNPHLPLPNDPGRVYCVDSENSMCPMLQLGSLCSELKEYAVKNCKKSCKLC